MVLSNKQNRELSCCTNCVCCKNIFLDSRLCTSFCYIASIRTHPKALCYFPIVFFSLWVSSICFSRHILLHAFLLVISEYSSAVHKQRWRSLQGTDASHNYNVPAQPAFNFDIPFTVFSLSIFFCFPERRRVIAVLDSNSIGISVHSWTATQIDGEIQKNEKNQVLSRNAGCRIAVPSSTSNTPSGKFRPASDAWARRYRMLHNVMSSILIVTSDI